jgi:glycosyltransferase involved in cell wall biosynthesis
VSDDAPIYRIGFLQTVMVGNMNRYRLLRQQVEADPTVQAKWYPLRSWVMDDWLRFLPGWLRVRVRHLFDSSRLFVAHGLDAVVVHAPEMYGVYGTFHAAVRRRVVLVENTDAPTRPQGRIGEILLTRAERRTDLFVPWSNYVSGEIRARVPDAVDRLHVIHPGLPIERWPLRRNESTTGRFRLLFVGADVERKGLDTLLQAHALGLEETCDLDIATQTQTLPASMAADIRSRSNVRMHLDLQPGSAELQDLFQRADALVLPTRYDLSPWVVVEALATGVPVIATNVGGIGDMIVDGRTGFLVEPDDPAGLMAAIRRLQALSREQVDELVRAGREHAEQHFDARANTAELLRLIKLEIDARR